MAIFPFGVFVIINPVICHPVNKEETKPLSRSYAKFLFKMLLYSLLYLYSHNIVGHTALRLPRINGLAAIEPYIFVARLRAYLLYDITVSVARPFRFT